ncbi:MAG: hypothetical protein PHR06_02310 [Candidatus Cloacimonetes bacterium]|nr:hypothetical protein [Candidatus Cloacimonadota bacterium]
MKKQLEQSALKKIIIFDTDIKFATNLASILHENNIDVIACYNGIEVIENLTITEFDAIMIAETEDYSTQNLINEIRMITPEIIIYMITDKSSHDTENYFINGVDEIIKRPFDHATLIESLNLYTI